jgi:hypothetical protein
MKHILKNKNLLEVLKDATPKLRKVILQNADHGVICSLVEIIVNLLEGRIKISPLQKKKLVRYKQQLRQISRSCVKHNKVINKKKARKLVIQSGGALPFLIPLLAPLIAKAALGGIVAATTGAITNKVLRQ